MTVLVTGCFDVLTVGHISLLKYAASYGDVVVGINSDRAVRELKGSTRPINNESDRAKLIGAFRMVSDTFIIDDTTVTTAIRDIRPDFWCKGGDYTLDTLNKQEVAAAIDVGAFILFAPKLEGYSSTKIIERMKS